MNSCHDKNTVYFNPDFNPQQKTLTWLTAKPYLRRFFFILMLSVSFSLTYQNFAVYSLPPKTLCVGVEFSDLSDRAQTGDFMLCFSLQSKISNLPKEILRDSSERCWFEPNNLRSSYALHTSHLKANVTQEWRECNAISCHLEVPYWNIKQNTACTNLDDLLHKLFNFPRWSKKLSIEADQFLACLIRKAKPYDHREQRSSFKRINKRNACSVLRKFSRFKGSYPSQHTFIFVDLGTKRFARSNRYKRCTRIRFHSTPHVWGGVGLKSNSTKNLTARSYEI